MNFKLKVFLQILIGTVGYSVWAFMAYDDASLRPVFLNFNVLMATGTIGLALRDMKTASEPAAPPKPTELPKDPL